MPGSTEAFPYFSVHPYLQERFSRVGRSVAFNARSVEEWRAWRMELIGKLKDLTGYASMLPCELEPRITEEREFPDYLRQRVVIQTEPGIHMPLFVLIPKGAKTPLPALIAPHGHASGGKAAVAGCAENPQIAQTIQQYNYDYGVQFVRAGFLVFCPDARGFGERQEAAAKGDLLASSCQWINQMAYPLGQTVTGMWAWDLHRLVDYIQTRPDCDGARIGCGGLSGGALQTLWAAALDERIRFAVISGYLYGCKESLLDDHTNCSCNYVPHLYETADMGDIAALIAPRPLLVETGSRDPLNGSSGLENVYSQVRILQRAYGLLGAEANLKHVVFDGVHRWDGVQSIPWLQQVAG